MKTRASVLIVAAALWAGIAAVSQDGHLIRYKFQANQTDRYKIDLNADMKMAGGAGDQEIAVKGSMDFALLTSAVDAEGKADVEMKTTNLKLTGSGMAESMMAGQELPKEITVKAKMDDRYRISEAKASGLDVQTQMMMGMSGAGSMTMIFELPEKPVKVGDTWTVTMPKNPMTGDKAHPLTAKLAGVEVVDGTPMYVIDISGTIDIDINLGEVLKKMNEAAGAAGGPGGGMTDMMAGMDITMKGSVKVSGGAKLDQVSGRLMRSQTVMEAKQTMTIGGVGLTVDVNGLTKVNMVLDKG